METIEFVVIEQTRTIVFEVWQFGWWRREQASWLPYDRWQNLLRLERDLQLCASTSGVCGLAALCRR